METPEYIVWKPKSEKKQKPKQPDLKIMGKDNIKNEKTRPEPPSEEENIKRMKEYEAIVISFLKSSDQTFEFPPNLNSFERRLIHEICEVHGLQHESQGEGKERHIVLKKIGIIQENDEQEKDESQPEEESNALKKEYEAVVDSFIKSSKKMYTFPSKLNAYERSIIHAICKEFNIQHESQGEGKNRHMVIQKKSVATTQQNSKDNHAKQTSEIIGGEISEHGTTLLREKNEESSFQNGAIPKCKSSDGSRTTIRTRFIGGKYEEVVVPVYDSKNSSTNYHTTNKEKEPKTAEVSSTKHCCNCGKDIIQQNYSIHNAQCVREMHGVQEERSKHVCYAFIFMKKNIYFYIYFFLII